MPQEVRFILKMSKQNPEHLYKKYFIQNKKSQGRLFQLSPHPHLKGWADFLLGKTNKTPYFWKKKLKGEKIVIGRTSLGSKGVEGGALLLCHNRLSIHMVWHADTTSPSRDHHPTLWEAAARKGFWMRKICWSLSPERQHPEENNCEKSLMDVLPWGVLQEKKKTKKSFPA